MAAPFDTPGVAGAEELVRRYVIFSTRSEQPQLEEHREYGLPGLEETRTRLADHGLEVGTWGNGNLHDWLAMMLTKHVLEVDHAFAPMEAGTDVLYNYVFSAREFVPPFYRHLIVGRRGETPAIPAAPERTEGDSDATAVLGAMLTATASVVGRWHTELHLGPYETYIRTAAEETNRRVDATLDAISRLEQRLVATEGKVDYLIERLRHPLRSLRAAVDRRRGDTD
jgi:hypothetical protein